MVTERARPDIGGAAIALVFLAIGIYAVWTSFAMTMLGAIFPRTIGGVLIGLSVIQIGLSFTGRGAQASGEGGETSKEGLGRRLALVAVMIAWALLFPAIGFVVTSFVAAVLLIFIAEHERTAAGIWLFRIAIVAAMVGAFYWLRARILYIPMPRGIFF
jgi:putative tricarboxylic transport membrane protein